MVKYLKKRKLYAIAKSLIKEELPSCKDCKYTFIGVRSGLQAEVKKYHH